MASGLFGRASTALGLYSPPPAANASYRRKPVSRKPDWIPPYRVRGRLSQARNDGPGEKAIPRSLLRGDWGEEETKTLMAIRSFCLQNPLIQQYNCASFGAARLARTKEQSHPACSSATTCSRSDTISGTFWRQKNSGAGKFSYQEPRMMHS